MVQAEERATPNVAGHEVEPVVIWQPVISIYRLLPCGGRSPNCVGIDPTRIWIGRTSDGQMYECGWRYREHERLAHGHAFRWDDARHGEFRTPVSIRNEAGDIQVSYVAYTDARWTELERMVQQIRGVEFHLNLMLRRD